MEGRLLYLEREPSDHPDVYSWRVTINFEDLGAPPSESQISKETNSLIEVYGPPTFKIRHNSLIHELGRLLAEERFKARDGWTEWCVLLSLYSISERYLDVADFDPSGVCILSAIFSMTTLTLVNVFELGMPSSRARVLLARLKMKTMTLPVLANLLVPTPRRLRLLL